MAGPRLSVPWPPWRDACVRAGTFYHRRAVASRRCLVANRNWSRWTRLVSNQTPTLHWLHMRFFLAASEKRIENVWPVFRDFAAGLDAPDLRGLCSVNRWAYCFLENLARSAAHNAL